jgi:hypothetical protein
MRSTTFFSNSSIIDVLKLNFLIALFVCFSLASHGQAMKPAPADSASSAQTQYVKIEVGMHILDCPVLPKHLKEKLMTVKGIKDYQEDAFTQSIYFSIPQGAITKEEIVKVATSCAFPPNTVNVLMAEKPFAR